MGEALTDRFTGLSAGNARGALLGAATLVVAAVALALVLTGVTTGEVAATALFLPVFAAGVLGGRGAGYAGAAVATLAYVALRRGDLSSAGPASGGVLTLTRAGAYLVAGHVGALARSLLPDGDGALSPSPGRSGLAAGGRRPPGRWDDAARDRPVEPAWDQQWETEDERYPAAQPVLAGVGSTASGGYPYAPDEAGYDGQPTAMAPAWPPDPPRDPWDDQGGAGGGSGPGAWDDDRTAGWPAAGAPAGQPPGPPGEDGRPPADDSWAAVQQSWREQHGLPPDDDGGDRAPPGWPHEAPADLSGRSGPPDQWSQPSPTEPWRPPVPSDPWVDQTAGSDTWGSPAPSDPWGEQPQAATEAPAWPGAQPAGQPAGPWGPPQGGVPGAPGAPAGPWGPPGDAGAPAPDPWGDQGGAAPGAPASDPWGVPAGGAPGGPASDPWGVPAGGAAPGGPASDPWGVPSSGPAAPPTDPWGPAPGHGGDALPGPWGPPSGEVPAAPPGDPWGAPPGNGGGPGAPADPWGPPAAGAPPDPWGDSAPSGGTWPQAPPGPEGWAPPAPAADDGWAPPAPPAGDQWDPAAPAPDQGWSGLAGDAWPAPTTGATDAAWEQPAPGYPQPDGQPAPGYPQPDEQWPVGPQAGWAAAGAGAAPGGAFRPPTDPGRPPAHAAPSAPMPAVDPETGLWTAKFLRDRLTSERARSRRSGRPFSLVLVQVPDGPLAQLPYRRQLTLLRELGYQFVAGGVVDHLVHVPDQAQHWFAVILPDTDRSGAQVIERRLRLGIGGYLSSRGLPLRDLESASLTAPDDDPAMGTIWEALIGPDDGGPGRSMSYDY